MQYLKKKEQPEFLTSYLKHNFTSFLDSTFNELDMAVFAFLSYFDFKNFFLKNNKLYIKDLFDASKIDTLLNTNNKNKEVLSFFTALCSSPRFREVEILDYMQINNRKLIEQFGAVTFLLPNKILVISYRGTNTTLTGWKEDFNIAYHDIMPSQVTALDYLNKTLIKFDCVTYLVGHSKGGALALYTYLNANKDAMKIKGVYLFDSPGIEDVNLNTLKEKGIIKKYIPTKSIVGMLFDTSSFSKIVKTDASLIDSHSLLKWEINGNKFKSAPSLDKKIESLNDSLSHYIHDKSFKERKLVVDLFYGLLKEISTDDLNEITLKDKKKLRTLRKKYQNLDENSKIIAKTFLKEIIGTILKGLI